MAYSSDDLTVVRAALLKGERRVEYADRVVEYRSITELKIVEQDILREMQSGSGRRQTKIIGSKGLC